MMLINLGMCNSGLGVRIFHECQGSLYSVGLLFYQSLFNILDPRFLKSLEQTSQISLREAAQTCGAGLHGFES